MRKEKILTIFIPAKNLELPENTSPVANLEDKIRKSIINMKKFPPQSTMVFIKKYQFDVNSMGYNVIAKVNNF